MMSVSVGAFAMISLLLVHGCDAVSQNQKLSLPSEFQAVFLDNGQVFFGRLENPGAPYPLLKDAFYVERQVNPTTKEVSNILIKRGNEWHSPDTLYLNSKHIIAIETVGPNSKVAQLIKEAKAKDAQSPK